jgi:hypothetical protein
MYRVEWIQKALDKLASIWIQADSNMRQAITAASHTIDNELQNDPFRQSESRDNDERVLFEYPLAALIQVDLQQRIVWVLHVWQFRRQGE